LSYFSDNFEKLDPFKNIKGSMDLRIIFRLFDAQPFLRSLWDFSNLFKIDQGALDEHD
jgi:hypothetical protein